MRRREPRARHARAHPRVDDSRLHREHAHAGRGVAIAQAAQIRAEARLGGAVDVVAPAAAVAGHRRQGAHEPAPVPGEVGGDDVQRGHGSREIRVDDPACFGRIGLRTALVAEVSEREHDALQVRRQAGRQRRGVPFHVERVDPVHPGGDAAAKPEIGGDDGELGFVASRQREVEAAPRELGGDRAPDGRRAAENEDRRHQARRRPSRRASDDESTPRGSRRAAIAWNSSRRGYIARTASGVVVESLAR